MEENKKRINCGIRTKMVKPVFRLYNTKVRSNIKSNMFLTVRKISLILISIFVVCAFSASDVSAQRKTPTVSVTVTATPSPTVTPEPTIVPRSDITKETHETVEPLKKLLDDQKLKSIFPFNFLKYAIKGSVDAGVAPNTVVLLLLLPGVALLITAFRQLIGIGGFGIFLPAALSVVFVATGPVIGILLFAIIVFVSTFMRIAMRRTKMKLQYLPRMSLVLLFVVMGILTVLFLAPIIKKPDITGVSIFPVLILVLLAEDFSKVQLGKSAKVAVNLAGETLTLSLLSYLFLTTKPVQEFALLNPEIWLIGIGIFDFALGKYIGLRLLEIWRFRNLTKV